MVMLELENKLEFSSEGGKFSLFLFSSFRVILYPLEGTLILLYIYSSNAMKWLFLIKKGKNLQHI